MFSLPVKRLSSFQAENNLYINILYICSSAQLMSTQPYRFVPSFPETSEPQPSRHPPHTFTHPHTIDLESSNPSISQHGLATDNTLTNLLMYESEYVPMKKQRRDRQQDENCIDEESQENEPTYYHDNTQDNKYEPSQQDSEDFLQIFLERFVDIFSHKVRIIQRSAFELIYISSSRRIYEDHPIPMDLSNSESEGQKKQSAITFNKANPFLDSPFSSCHQQNPVSTLSFNSNIKRKPNSPSTNVSPTKPIQIHNQKAVGGNIKVSQNEIERKKIKQENYKPSKPVIRLLADCIREENINEVGLFQNFEPLEVEESRSSSPEYEPQSCQYLKTNREEEKKLYDSKTIHIKKNRQFQYPHKNQNRPTSFYMKNENPTYMRPVSNFQSPTHAKPSSIFNVPNQEPFFQYGNIMMNKNTVTHTNAYKPVTPASQSKNASPFRKVNITYKNSSESEHQRSHSQFARYAPSLQQSTCPSSSNQVSIRVQAEPPKINVVRSQYYITRNPIPSPVVVHTNQQKRLHSAPSSPLPQKFCSQESIEHKKKILQEKQEAENETRQVLQQKKQKQHQKVVNNAHLSVKNSPVPLKPTSPRVQMKKEEKSQSEEVSEYFQFTRPKKKQADKVNNSSSVTSLRSGKGKKINIVSKLGNLQGK